MENSWVTAPLPPNPDATEEDSETTTLPQDDGERCQVSYQNTLLSVKEQIKPFNNEIVDFTEFNCFSERKKIVKMLNVLTEL